MDILRDIERMLDMPDAEKAQVMREIGSHYEEIRDELTASGMEPARAEREAATRLGDPRAIASRLSAVHCVAPWRSAALAAVPFLASGLTVGYNLLHGVWAQAMLAALVLSGVLIVAGTVWGFVRGGRPIWLPMWTAAGITAAYSCINAASYAAGIHRHSGFAYLMTLSVVAPALAAIWLCWRLRRWRWAAILIPVCGAGLFFLSAFCWVRLAGPGSKWFMVGPNGLLNLALAAVWVLVALRVFAADRYGSAAQAALFLFAVRVPPYCWMNPIFFDPWAGLGNGVIGVVAVIAFARASSFAAKLAVLGTALVVAKVLWTVSYAQTMSRDPRFAARAVSWFTASQWVGVSIGLAAMLAVALYHVLQRRARAGCAA